MPSWGAAAWSFGRIKEYLLGLLGAEFDVVLLEVPLLEGSGVDLDDGALGEGLGSD